MAFDTDAVIIGGTGHMYVGDVGATAPVDLLTPWSTSVWSDLGWIGPDGLSMTPGADTEDITAWQADYPIRRIITARTFEVSATFLEWNKLTVPLAFGGGDITQVDAGNPFVISTAYTLGQFVEPIAPNGRIYEVTTAGTSAGTSPTWPTTEGSTVTSGTVVFTDRGAGSTAVYKYQLPTGNTIDERSFGFDWEDGDRIYRFTIARGAVSDVGDMNVQKGEAAGLEITFTMFGAESGSPGTFLSNAAAWAP